MREHPEKTLDDLHEEFDSLLRKKGFPKKIIDEEYSYVYSREHLREWIYNFIKENPTYTLEELHKIWDRILGKRGISAKLVDETFWDYKLIEERRKKYANRL